MTVNKDKISDERLDELRAQHEKIGLVEWVSLARELRDYRKAVKAYLDAVDARNRWFDEDGDSPYTHAPPIPPEANLRALQEGT